MKKSKCCNSKAIKQEAGNYFCSHCISICNTKLSFKTPIILLLISIFMLLSLNSFAPKNRLKSKFKIAITDTTDMILSDSSIYFKSLELGSYFPEVACRQAKAECGINFDSKICKENKNLFGLKCNCKYVKGKKNGHSYYNSYTDCLKCYINFTNKYWDKYCHNYAEDKCYLKKLKALE